MKKIQIPYLAMAGLCLIISAAQAQSTTFKVNGKLEHISPMPSKMYLSEIISGGMLSKPLDSATVINGKYEFTGKINADEAIGVNISPQLKGAGLNDNIPLIVDKGELLVVSKDFVGNFTVTGNGSEAHRQFETMRAGTKAATDSIKAMTSLESYKTDKKLQAEVQRKSLNMLGQIIFDMYTYIKKYPENRISPYATYFLITLPYLQQPGKDTIISLLPSRTKNDLLGQAIINKNKRDKFLTDSAIKVAEAKNAEMMSKVAVGSKAPEFTQNDVDGKPIKLSSFKGKYVLVDFWASWCAPCRAENPNVVKAYQQYKDKGFTVLGVSLDGTSTKTAWKKAIEKDGLTWTQVSDLNGWKNSVATLYDIKSIPQNFLIGPDGTIIGKNLRGESLNVKLASLFNK